MTVYLAGPMRSRSLHNYPAFDKAAQQLRSLGFDVVSPADIGRHYGIHETTSVDAPMLKDLYLADLGHLVYCDAVFLLRGWQQSLGVAGEIAVARALDIPVFERLGELLVHREAA